MSTVPLSELNLFNDLKFEKRNLIFLDSPFSFFEFAINFLSLQNFFSFNVVNESLHQASFLQVATIDFIFIIDLRKMKQLIEKCKKVEWFFCQMDLLFQSTILKIAFNLNSSFQSLNNMFQSYFLCPSNILDIKDLYKLKNIDISTVPYYNYILNFHKNLALKIQTQENLALYTYLILLIYMNITKENTSNKHISESSKTLNLVNDLNFSGSIALINENNIESLEILVKNLKKQSVMAIDSVCCPKDHVMDLLLIGTMQSIFIIDIKGIKKKIFINSRKIKSDNFDSSKCEILKSFFLSQLNEILQSENILKISYEFNLDFKCLKNRFSKDITSVNHLLNLKKYNKILNIQESATFNEVVFSFFKKKLATEDIENKQNFFHPLALFNLSTKLYCLLCIFENKIKNVNHSPENIILLQPTINVKKEQKMKNSAISLNEYEMFYPNLALSNCFPIYYDYSNLMLIQDLMSLRISNEFLTLKDLNFNEEKIFLIDKLDDIYEHSLAKIKEKKIIGIDSEWHPNETVTAILQIATDDEIFIFDFYGFKKNMKYGLVKNSREDCFLKFYQGINEILISDEIIKIAFDFNNDRVNLSKLHEIFNHEEYNKMLDFVYYRSAILGQNKGGLKDLVLRIFNKSLCKSMVLSNWKQRPLSDQQIKYAALDAFIVLQIYLRIKDNLYLEFS